MFFSSHFSHLISFHFILSHFSHFSHLISILSSHLISSHLISLISSHLISSYLISLISSHFSHLISSHLISSHFSHLISLISPHLVSSHLVSSHFIAWYCLNWLLLYFKFWRPPCFCRFILTITSLTASYHQLLMAAVESKIKQFSLSISGKKRPAGYSTSFSSTPSSSARVPLESATVSLKVSHQHHFWEEEGREQMKMTQ